MGRLKINPAFAEAHGLSEAAKNADAWEKFDEDLASSQSASFQFRKAISEARKTGKLIASSVGLTSPTLPDAMFDLRNELIAQYDGAMDGNDNFWECYGEEMLTMVDISDNDLSEEKEEGEKNSTTMRVLDTRIGCYTALKTLRLRNCNLDNLPWEIIRDKLDNLSVLDARGNRFTKIPLNILPQSTTALYLADNNIESLGSDIEEIDLPSIHHLDVANNKLIRLPSKLKCPKLQCLVLTKNDIESVSKTFLYSCEESLKTLEIGENQLKVSMNLSQHTKLEVLELRANKLKSVPVIHSNLVKLGLSFNAISSLEGLYPFLDECDENGKTNDGDYFRTSLSELHLESNNFTNSLHSPTLAVMTKLSLLDVSHNALENIPHVVGYLPILKKVLLDGNPFRMIRNSIKYKANGTVDTTKLLASLRNKGPAPQAPGYYGQNFEQLMDKNIAETPMSVIEAKSIVRKAVVGNNTLDISGRGLEGKLVWKELIDALLTEDTSSDGQFHGSKISTWKVTSGKITSFTAGWVEALPSIVNFDAFRNSIESLPPNIQKLSLQNIQLQKNCITSTVLKDQLCCVGSNLAKNLMHLDLSNNNIEWIPEDIFSFPALTHLNLSYNKIKTLAWQYDEDLEEGRGWREGLPSLEHLDLSNNSISNLGYLPLALSGCGNLRTLLLNNNCIYEIPLELGLLDQLSNLDLLGNSQRKIRVRVLTQNCKNILEYLRERMTPEELREATENHREIREAIEEENGDNGDTLELMKAMSEDNYQSEGEEEEMHVSPVEQKENVQSGKEKFQSMKENVNVSSHNETSKVPETSDSIIDELKESIAGLTVELENLSISEAKRFALKKELAMQRSKLIREQRKLKA